MRQYSDTVPPTPLSFCLTRVNCIYNDLKASHLIRDTLSFNALRILIKIKKIITELIVMFKMLKMILNLFNFTLNLLLLVIIIRLIVNWKYFCESLNSRLLFVYWKHCLYR